jgi:general secretion pathway protein G
VRKDGRLNPLNTDFDLFSTGKDGDTTGPLNARASRDDVVRANNGAFIGLGENY